MTARSDVERLLKEHIRSWTTKELTEVLPYSSDHIRVALAQLRKDKLVERNRLDAINRRGRIAYVYWWVRQGMPADYYVPTYGGEEATRSRFQREQEDT